MAYSTALALRVRQIMQTRRGVVEKKMFGGVGFLLHGNMCVGIWQNALIVRLGPTAAVAALQEPYVTEFDITGRPMKGWAMVQPEGLETDQQLANWIDRCWEFVCTLEPK